MRERERESARARDRDLQSAISPSLIAISSPQSPARDPAPSLIAISSPRSHDAVDRDLAFARLHRIEIAIDGAISRRSRSRRQSRSCEDHDLAVDRDLAFARSHQIKIAIDGANLQRSRSRLREIAIAPSIAISDRDQRRGRRTLFSVVVDDFFLGCGLCFSGFVFSFFFSKHQKIFSGKFFEMQPNTMETFSFSGN